MPSSIPTPVYEALFAAVGGALVYLGNLLVKMFGRKNGQ